MPKIELEQITTPYEFEDRASLFLAEVEKIASRYTSSRIEVENTTTARMEDLQKRIHALRLSGKEPDLLKKLTTMEYDLQIQSASKNRVIVTMYTHTSRPITPFEIKVDTIATNYRGIKDEDGSETFDFEDDENEETYRYVAVFIYDFKNDIKK